jgi:hypothetical protein
MLAKNAITKKGDIRISFIGKYRIPSTCFILPNAAILSKAKINYLIFFTEKFNFRFLFAFG